jgi:hypothetical protein
MNVDVEEVPRRKGKQQTTPPKKEGSKAEVPRRSQVLRVGNAPPEKTKKGGGVAPAPSPPQQTPKAQPGLEKILVEMTKLQTQMSEMLQKLERIEKERDFFKEKLQAAETELAAMQGDQTQPM